MKKRLALLLLVVLSFAVLQNRPISLELKPVVIKAGEFSTLLGKPREKIVVAAIDETGARRAVPFQIDPIGADGEYILGPARAPSTAPRPAGALGRSDEIVFMASDAGAVLEGPGARVLVTDPVSGEKRAVFVVEDGGIELSREDYVGYRLLEKEERIVTPAFTQVMNRAEIFFKDLMVSKAAGGDGRDLFDKLKMRSKITTVGGFTLSYSEADFRSELTGVRDGPVRVIRRTSTSLNLLLGIGTPSVRVNAFFYRNSWEVPSTLQFPFRADLVLNNIDYLQGCDLSAKAFPLTYYADVAPGGVKMDGMMSDKEKKLAAGRPAHRWGLVTGPAGTMYYQGSWTEPGVPVKLGLFYEDDSAINDPPEFEPGVSMFGFRLLNALDMGDRAYDLNIANYVIPNFSGGAERMAEALSTPLKVEVRERQ